MRGITGHLRSHLSVGNPRRGISSTFAEVTAAIDQEAAHHPAAARIWPALDIYAALRAENEGLRRVVRTLQEEYESAEERVEALELAAKMLEIVKGCLEEKVETLLAEQATLKHGFASISALANRWEGA